MRGTVTLLGVVLAGCAPRGPLLERAIAARGGSVGGLVREVDVDVTLDFAGRWHWRTVFALPDRYAWSIATTGAPQHYLFDGTVVRAFVGDTLVSEDPSPGAPLRSQARFVAVANLDALRLPGVQVSEASHELVAVFPDRGDRYVVRLDAEDRVTEVTGPADFSPFARGTLHAAYEDWGRIDGRVLARRTRYVLDGEPLAVETVRRACVLATAPPASAFATPGALPGCR